MRQFPPRSPPPGGGMSGAGRGASANPAGNGDFWGQTGRKADGRGIPPPPPRIFQARRGAFFAQFTGAGSPPSASARPAPRSPAAARARIPRMLRQEARERGGDNPSNAGVFGGVERARRVRSGDYPPGHSRRVQGAVFARAGRQRPESARGRIPQRHGARGGALRPAQRNRESIFPPSRPAFGGFGRMRRAGRVRGRRRRRKSRSENRAAPRPFGWRRRKARLPQFWAKRRRGARRWKSAVVPATTTACIAISSLPATTRNALSAPPGTFPHGCGRIKSGIREGGDSSSLQSPRKKDGAKADNSRIFAKTPLDRA